MNLKKYRKWRKLIQTSSKVSLFSAPAALRSHPRLVDLPFSFHMFWNSHFEVNGGLEALLIPSPRRFPRCIPAPMCVYSPRPENQKRNWQVRGDIKVCGAAQKYITRFFVQSHTERHDKNAWPELNGIIHGGSKGTVHVFLPHLFTLQWV